MKSDKTRKKIKQQKKSQNTREWERIVYEITKRLYRTTNTDNDFHPDINSTSIYLFVCLFPYIFQVPPSPLSYAHNNCPSFVFVCVLSIKGFALSNYCITKRQPPSLSLVVVVLFSSDVTFISVSAIFFIVITISTFIVDLPSSLSFPINFNHIKCYVFSFFITSNYTLIKLYEKKIIFFVFVSISL